MVFENLKILKILYKNNNLYSTIKDMDIMYGWFSKKQKEVLTKMNEEGKIGNSSIFYLNEKNEKVEVTEVTRKEGIFI